MSISTCINLRSSLSRSINGRDGTDTPGPTGPSLPENTLYSAINNEPLFSAIDGEPLTSAL